MKGFKAMTFAFEWGQDQILDLFEVSMLLESLPSFNATPSGCKPWPEKLALFSGNFWGLPTNMT